MQCFYKDGSAIFTVKDLDDLWFAFLETGGKQPHPAAQMAQAQAQVQALLAQARAQTQAQVQAQAPAETLASAMSSAAVADVPSTDAPILKWRKTVQLGTEVKDMDDDVGKRMDGPSGKRMRTATSSKRWTAEEEQKLIAALDQARTTHKGDSVWTEVSRIMGDRTNSALKQHWCARQSQCAWRYLGRPRDCDACMASLHAI